MATSFSRQAIQNETMHARETNDFPAPCAIATRRRENAAMHKLELTMRATTDFLIGEFLKEKRL